MHLAACRYLLLPVNAGRNKRVTISKFCTRAVKSRKNATTLRAALAAHIERIMKCLIPSERCGCVLSGTLDRVLIDPTLAEWWSKQTRADLMRIKAKQIDADKSKKKIDADKSKTKNDAYKSQLD